MSRPCPPEDRGMASRRHGCVLGRARPRHPENPSEASWRTACHHSQPASCPPPVHPLPLSVFLPMFSLFHVLCPFFLSPYTNFVPLRQGAKRVFRRSTECASVPSEGRKGPLEKVFNILSCPLRGALSSATRGKLSSATLDRGTKFRRGYVSFPFPVSSSNVPPPPSQGGSGWVLPPPPIYYIIRYIHPSSPFSCPSGIFFRQFLKKSSSFLCRFAEKSYLCTRKTGTPPTSHHGGCFPALRRKSSLTDFHRQKL